MENKPINGRTHDPDLRELVAELDGFRDLMNERELRYRDKFLAQDEKTSLALTASKEAVAKAEVATEKRFEGVNEFRKTLSDQAATLFSRTEAEARLGALNEKLESVRLINSERTGRSTGISVTVSLLLVIAGLVCVIVFGILTLVIKK